MPRINQLPVASSVAQTDVLAIDTADKTYKVPRSVLAPAPFVVSIPTGQWSGSGSDRYITVQASNVTADAMLYPFYDDASSALLNGPVWAIPAAGSFTIHTSAIPSGTVTISVLLAGIVGEAQYQVLADVYSKSQAVAKADIVDNLTSTATNQPLSAAQGRLLDLKNRTWSRSTTSFDDALTKIGHGGGYFVETLNTINANISTYTANAVNNVQITTTDPYFGVTFYKLNDNYYGGFIFGYYSDVWIAFRKVGSEYCVRTL